MLSLIIIIWIAWSLCRPHYNGMYRPYGGWYRRPPMGRSIYGSHVGGWHHPPMSGFHHPHMGGFGGGGRAFGGGHTMGGGAGRGRR